MKQVQRQMQQKPITTKWFLLYPGKGTFDARLIHPTTPNEAWEKTLSKWAYIVEMGYQATNSASTCGLCNLYRQDHCFGCPIKMRTGRPQCHATPYNAYVSATYDRMIAPSLLQHLALAEYNFLRETYEEWLLIWQLCQEAGTIDDEREPEPDVDDSAYLCAECERPMPSYHGPGSLCRQCQMIRRD